MDEMGKAMMGTGEDDGENRAIQAAEKAIANPLLDEISLRGAKGVLINITGGHDLTLFELDEAANRIREEVDPDANIIVGSTLDPSMEGAMRVSVVATGIDATEVHETPVPRRSLAEPLKQPEAVHVDTPAVAEADAPEPIYAEEPEPSLFQNAEPSHVVADERMQEVFEDEDGYDEAMEPAFQPRVEEFTPARQAGPEASRQPQPAQQPAARAPGTPSPEAMQRLQTAVNKAPVQPQQRRPADPAADDRQRFGINSLINRMTGQGGPEAPRPHRQQPQVQSSPTQQAAPRPQDRAQEDDEQIEIPAFLRRQAN
jgi:cell division protein FtsZ